MRGHVNRILETDGLKRLFHRILGYAVGDEGVERRYEGSEGGRVRAGGEEERFDIFCGVVVFFVAIVDVPRCVVEDIYFVRIVMKSEKPSWTEGQASWIRLYVA